MFEVDDDPVNSRTGHDLYRLDGGDGGDRPEGRASLPPLLTEAVERREVCRGQNAISRVTCVVSPSVGDIIGQNHDQSRHAFRPNFCRIVGSLLPFSCRRGELREMSGLKDQS